jgi:hypothetical protein
MAADPHPPVDRFLIAAAVDRLIYDSDIVFPPQDARILLEVLPRRPTPWIEFGISGKMSGTSNRGYAAGMGDVDVKDDKERQFEFSTAKDAYTRAGQWKLLWHANRDRQYIDIEQVMADATDEGRGAQIVYEGDGKPLSMNIRVNRSFRLFWTPVVIIIPGWRPWKTPAP